MIRKIGKMYKLYKKCRVYVLKHADKTKAAVNSLKN